MNEQKWVSISEAAKFYGVSLSTLRRWDEDKKVSVKRTTNGQRRFLLQHKKDPEEEKLKICYCRVSSAHQKGDLDRQIKFMQSKYPTHQIWSDIGSGINWKRLKFNKILEYSQKGLIEEIVVAYRDRFCRFAFELLENVLKYNGTKLVVLNQKDDSNKDELTKDIMSILQVYICKENGKRKYTKKQPKNKPIKTIEGKSNNE